MRNILISDSTMSDFFEDWISKIDSILKKENKNSIIELNCDSYFNARNIEKDYDTMLKNLHLIYGDNTNVDQQVSIFDEALNFLQQVIQVEGADRLFSKHFYGMEWNMFLEADFENSKMNVYRDHFLHQIRNAYLGFILIWEMDFYKNIIEAIKKYKYTGFSSFINMYAKKEKNVSQEVFYAEVIKKSWFLAAFFHDIGYPISYYYRFSSRVDKYMPYLRILDKRSHMDFVDLSSLLCDSYLFKMVDYNELKQKYDKLDHGMLSAVCLLLNYYHGGLVHQLSNQDRCSIELAAYTIFLHTRKYSIQQKEKKSKWVKPSFVEDPISYLLRICDDLQEWSRIYFLIGENSNVLICDDCNSLVKRDLLDEKKYKCGCGRQFEKLTTINYRKINLVGACERLNIIDDGKKIVFKLDYNLLSLLEVIELDNQYAKYRLDELQNLGKLFLDQILLPKIEIDYFLSNNPVKIKAEIIKKLIIKRFNIDIEKITSDIFIHYRKMIEEIILNKYKEIKHANLSNNDLFKESLNNELDSIQSYLVKISNNNDFILRTNEIPNDILKNIFVYKSIYDELI